MVKTLKDKKILLGITGSIAAYKAPLLVRLLVRAEASVRVIATPDALDFVTPLTLATLSRNPVLSKFQKDETGTWNNHVELGLWADAMVIAPLSANTLSKIATGRCDNLLMATYLSARCPVFLAPAMDLDMLKHPATRENLEKAEKWGIHLIKPGYGELASGLIGDGRMAEPDEIAGVLEKHFATATDFTGKKVLVTSGPTFEALDPVRFIGNHSSGKMGLAIAETMAKRGAMVHLVSGPTRLHTNHPNITVHPVMSSEEMFQACSSLFPDADITVLAAAVADYKPATTAPQKIKKKDDTLNLKLIRTTDIAATLGSRKNNGQVIVGFALETENEKANALRKMESKNFDLIVLNSLNDNGAGFGHDTNKVTIIDRKQNAREFTLKSKSEVAEDIANAILEIQHL